MSNRLSKKQNLAVLVAAVCIVILSVLVTLYFSDFRVENVGGRYGGEGFQNVTYTDAVITCQENTKNKFAGRYKTLVVDSHSSRYDGKSFLYKIFLEVDVVNQKDSGTTLNYVNCFVKSSNGRIAKFESYEEKDDESAVPGRDTNMFGWPR